jgi:hypothetical protein
MGIRASMARNGIAPMQLGTYEDPERGHVDPMADPETRAALWAFVGAIWRACVRAEADRGV